MKPFSRDEFLTLAINSKLNNFDELAASLYQYQQANNPVLQNFIKQTNGKNEFRFLPVDFFKTHQITSEDFIPEKIFTSSTTGGGTPSKHYVRNNNIYIKSYLEAFCLFYGEPSDYVFLCLLPSYLEREGSSLIDMAGGLIRLSNNIESGYYLYDFKKLEQTIIRLRHQNKKIFLLGVTFALIDFAEECTTSLKDVIVMETGGMKGRRKENTRAEIHDFLKSKLGINEVHSEYGMTELLSQAYSKGNGIFECPPWMKIVITDINDPFKKLPAGRSGMINVIDLANIDSCAFIQTSDIGKVNQDGTFEVLGRLDHSDIRGCNLMYL